LKTIVVFLQNRNFFGAQIVHIPFLKALRKEYPTSKIVLFSKTQLSNLLLELQLADALIIEKSRMQTLKTYINLKAAMTINLRKQSLFLNSLISFCNFGKKLGYRTFLTKLFFTKTTQHDVTVYRAQNYLNILDKKLQYEERPLSKHIILIPGAGDKYKIWKIENYIKVAQYLQEKYSDYTVGFVLGKEEKGFLPLLEKNFVIHYNLDINSLYSILCEAHFVLANDCGPSHIAQISRVKNLILFSDEEAKAREIIKEWFNPSEIKSYLIGEAMQSINTITVEEVIKKIDTMLEKESS
jgi:ADP-heptose:LPS heptosyltransferase